jgi:hypothetical protein
MPPPLRKDPDPVYKLYLTAYHIDQAVPIRKPEAPPAHRFQTNPSNNGTATVIVSSSIVLMMPMISPEEPLIPPLLIKDELTKEKPTITKTTTRGTIAP